MAVLQAFAQALAVGTQLRIGLVRGLDAFKKQRRAFYIVLVFNGDGATVAELERNLRIFEQVLRYMTTQIDPNRPPIELHRPRRDGMGEDGAEGEGDDEPREARRRNDDIALDESADADVPDLS